MTASSALPDGRNVGMLCITSGNLTHAHIESMDNENPKHIPKLLTSIKLGCVDLSIISDKVSLLIISSHLLEKCGIGNLVHDIIKEL